VIDAGKTIFLCALALLCIGVLMVHSAGLSVEATSAVTFESIIFSRSSLYMLTAVIAMSAIAFLPIDTLAKPTRLSRWTPALIPLLLLGLLAVYAPVFGHTVNGAARWLQIPGTGFSFQPSEFAKWGVILIAAWYARMFSSRLSKFFTGLAPILIIIGTIVAVIALEDLGTAFLISCVTALVLIAAGARIRHFLLIAPIACAALVAFVITSDYRVRRLTSFIDPYADPNGAGYHIIQSMVAIANGNITGRGLGFGLQKFGYLPEDQTDFLFSIIAEELGIAGVTLIISIYIAMLLAGLNITRRQTDPLLRFAALGITITVAFQACMNLLVVTGLMPTKGIALPLLSSGGTGWILTAASLGMLIAMDRTAPKPAHAGAPDEIDEDLPDCNAAVA